MENNKVDISDLQKDLKKKKQEEANLLNVIASGNVMDAALNSITSKLNTISEDIKTLEAQIDKNNKPSRYKILTYDYFKQLCHEGSKLLTHSSLAEKRAFIEKCIETVTLDPVRC